MTPVQQIRITKILIVEDNKIDARLTSQAIHMLSAWPAKIDVVEDGEKAMKFLGRHGVYSTAEKPDLVILDLNLPKCDGSEVLQFIRASETLKGLLVFIFSSSPVDVAEDRMDIAHVKADCYFEKPNQMGTYSSIVAEIWTAYQRLSDSSLGATA